MSALTVAPSNPRVLYAGTRDGKVYRSTDAGVSWRDVTGGFPLGRPVEDLEVDPRNPAKAYAAVCDPEDFRRTPNATATWRRLATLGGECVTLNRLVIDPQTPAHGSAHGVRGDRKRDVPAEGSGGVGRVQGQLISMGAAPGPASENRSGP